MIPKQSSIVLVTGGSGFIASQCIIQLLEAGHKVKTTIRSRQREADVLAMLKSAGVDPEDALSFFVADLMSDEGWSEAAEDCTYVLHVASPFPVKTPKHEDDLIIPAREGALRVLKAARDAGVSRVVMTSSFAAIGYGHNPTDEIFTEKDWTNLDAPDLSAYVKSKTIAERAAWNFITSEGGNLELSVINPVGVLGPVLGNDYSTSIQLVKRLMDGSINGCPRLSFGIVDVRDVADLHIRAMLHPSAKGERFLAVAGKSMSMVEIALLLRAQLGEDWKKIPTKILPDWLLRLVAVFDKSIAQVVQELGNVKNASSNKAKSVLGWSPLSNEEAIFATADSLIKLGILGKK